MLCKNCNVEQPSENFSIQRFKKDGSPSYRSRCKKCISDQNLDIYHNKGGKEKQKKRSFKHNLKRYNITPDDYFNLLEKQNNKCAICKTNKSHRSDVSYNLFVDHDHKTGKVRGLLCHHCNAGLGHFMDNTDFLKSSIEYLNANSS
jgi:hypothetical protein